MKSATIIVLLTIAVATVSGQTKYTNKFDSINVDGILNNDRILNNYIKCLLDKGPCTTEGRTLKKSLPDALATNCEKCTEVQRRNSNKIFQFLQTRRPDDWKTLSTRYDPNGNYKNKYTAAGR